MNATKFCKSEDQGKVLQFKKGLITIQFRADHTTNDGGFLLDFEDGDPPITTAKPISTVSTTTPPPTSDGTKSPSTSKTTQGFTTVKPAAVTGKQTSDQNAGQQLFL